MPGANEQTELTFKKDGYDSKFGESSGFVSWTHVFGTTATPDGVLIYLQKDVLEWLPKTAFTSEADYNRFLDLLAAKTKHIKLG